MRAEVEYRMGISGGSATRLFRTLERENFVTLRSIPLVGRWEYMLAELTEGGKILAEHVLGCGVRPSEWQLLTEKHNAEEHQRHAFAILLFAYHARRRGWKAEVCPQVDNPLTAPDALVEKDGERVYVEVEVLRHPKRRKDGADNTWARKWRNQYQFQNLVAVCTLTPKRREGIVAYLKPRWRGAAADILTLAKNPDCGLWVERWEWPNEFSMRGYV